MAEEQDQVLTDDEKEALLDGVESGEVEVQSTDGPKYAYVEKFEVTPRNTIVTNSFPSLTKLNRSLAAYIGKAASILLNDKVEVVPGPLTVSTWGEFREQSAEIAVMHVFSAAPLEGNAVIYAQKSFVQHTVETFFGGHKDNPPRHETEGFTLGEMNVIARFGDDIAKGVAETWDALIKLEPERAGLHQSTDIIEVIENSASVIATEFDIEVGEDQFYFHIVWPRSMIAPLIPVFEGQKRDRDAAQDAHWEATIRSRLPEALVDISSCVGEATMSLREVAVLDVGDVIGIENPRKGTVFAKHVPVLEGRFGVHDGNFALETMRWLNNDPAQEAAVQ